MDDETTTELVKSLSRTLDKAVETMTSIEKHRHIEATQNKFIAAGIMVIFLLLIYFS